MTVKVPEGHRCEAPRCNAAAPNGRTCSDTCRTRLWKLEHDYRDPRRARRRRRRSPAATRYAILEIRGSVLEVLAFDVAPNKRAAEGAFGIRDRDDLVAVAAARLPVSA